MKIEKIRIENLNSLYGVHELDLTSEEYQKENLFLMWGDTGAGKTTVLDALTLALYGRSSRIDRVNKNSNPLMSKGTRKCSAEVTFTVDGVRYRARWAQEYRPRNITELGDYKQELAILEEGKEDRIITGDRKKIIENVIHLNFDQFTKTVLLAQGGFEGFFNADVKTRATLLEQLTGTDIYTKISKKAFEVTKEKKIEMEKAQMRLGDVQLLSSDEIENYQNKLLENQESVKCIEMEITSLNEQINWIKRIEDAQKRLNSVLEEKNKHELALAAFVPKRAQLELAEKAAGIAPDYDHAVSARLALKQENEGLAALTARLDGCEKAQNLAQTHVKTTEQTLAMAREECEKNQPLFKDVRRLQAEMNEAERAQSDAVRKLKNAEEEKLQINQKLSSVQAEIHTLETRIANAGIYFTEHAADENLTAEIEVIRSERNQLEQLFNDVNKAASTLSSAQKDFAKAEKELKTAESGCQKIAEKRQQALENLNKAKSVYDSALNGHSLVDLENLKDSYLREKSAILIIANYEEQRKHLADGESCPLCGSKNHPYCVGAPKVSEIDSKINQTEAMIKTIRSAKSAFESAEKFDADCELELQKYRAALETMRQSCEMKRNAVDEKASVLKGFQVRFDGMLSSFDEMVSKYGVSAKNIDDVNQACASLKKRKDTWDLAKQTIEEIQKNHAEKTLSLASLNSSAESAAKNVDMMKSDVEEKSAVVNEKRQEIDRIFGDKNVDAEEKRLNNAVNQADKIYRKALDDLASANTELEKIRTGIEERRNNVQVRENALQNAEYIFNKGLQSQQFSCEADFLAARLSNHDLNSLQEYAKKLDKDSINLAARENQASAALAETQEKAMTTRSCEELSSEFAVKKSESQRLTQEIGAIQTKLEHHKQNETKAQALQDAFDNTKKIYERWNQLNELIGQSDGGKYNKFAQGITFNILLNNANGYLQKRGLLPRYELVRSSDDDQSLEFNVFDYLTGESREARNMSGGEKFCLCLALALGLSEMANKNTRIESLFIDEGMGTLDDGTLDVALTMLQQLSRESHGRQIGLITHVARAKELIDNIVIAEKIGGGRSTLVGPGCRKIKSEEVVKRKKKD